MKKAIATIYVGLLMSVAFVSGVLAQSQQKPAPAATAPAAILGIFSGTIAKIDTANKEISVKQGKGEKSFCWGEHTKIMQGGKEISIFALKKGTDVTIEYNRDGAKLMAQRVDVNTPKTSG